MRNLAASTAWILIACSAYVLTPHGYRQYQTLYGTESLSFRGGDFLITAAVCYTAILGVYFLAQPGPGVSKSLRAWRVINYLARSLVAGPKPRLSSEDRLAILATLLKIFFGPLMVMSLMTFCTNALMTGEAIASSNISTTGFRNIFNSHGFWFLMQLILFIDVLLFTLGYLIETPSLGNQIRSVDPTILGWAAALLCYPPFNEISGALLGSAVSDFPQFENPTAHLFLNVVLLALLATYAWASVALGFKASNLTHRGIVARGPYRVVRHPAYVCKNVAWWIASVPLIFTSFALSPLDGIQTLASVAGWTLLYVLRAITEEDHLRSVDEEYAAYAAKVRYRFIPGVL